MDITQESIKVLSYFWQFGLLALAISAITFLFRKVLEFFVIQNPKVPLTKTSLFWRDLFLPILPILIGGFFGYFITSYPYPAGINDISSRILFGLVGGMMSGTIYRIIKKIVLAKVGLKDEDEQINPSIIDDDKTEPGVNQQIVNQQALEENNKNPNLS